MPNYKSAVIAIPKTEINFGVSVNQFTFQNILYLYCHIFIPFPFPCELSERSENRLLFGVVHFPYFL